MTFDELYQGVLEQSLNLGMNPDVMGKVAGGVQAAKSLNPNQWGKMEFPVPGIENPERETSVLETALWEIAKIADPTGVLSYKDAMIASGRMYDEYLKKLNNQPNHYYLSLLVFVLCVYASLPNVALLAGGIGGLAQYTGKVGARLTRHQLTKALSKDAKKELGMLERTAEDYFKKNPDQLVSIMDLLVNTI